MLSAAEIGAPHKRERWWLLAHSNSDRDGREVAGCFQTGPRMENANGAGCEVIEESAARPETNNLVGTPSSPVPNPHSQRCQRGFQEQPERAQQEALRCDSEGTGREVSNTEGQRLQTRQQEETFGEMAVEGALREHGRWWEVEPAVGRVVNGLPMRVDRIKSLGNSVVWQCAREAFQSLAGIRKEN